MEFISIPQKIAFRRVAKRLPLVLCDACAVLVALWAAFAIRMGDPWPWLLERSYALFPLAVLITVPMFFVFGVYRSVLLYAGRNLLYVLVRCISLALLLIIACWVLIEGPNVPRSAWFIYWFVLLAISGGYRLLLRDYLRREFSPSPAGKRVLIYGAGIAGVQLATALQQDPELKPVAFIDDDEKVQGSEILGLKVYPPERLKALTRRKNVATVLLAIPSASRRRRSTIIDGLAPLPVQVLIMPGLTELASGKKRVSDLREVDIDDLLNRNPIDPDEVLLGACVSGKVVLVTGAGGSIGSELCRQIVRQRPRRLILFELSEYALYTIERELRDLCSSLSFKLDLIPILGSVNHLGRVKAVFDTFSVQTVYHAAAYKHVPIVEHNPIEGVQNNIFGTLYVAEAAGACGAETFVLVSTDKAVRPTNVMGATKRLAELVLLGLAQRSQRTRFCIVRFGNVLASSGSVVPLFREQIRRGGPVTVTHPDMVRYFMTIPEAAQLVIQAGALAEGGETFLLDMGEPVSIAKLARRMVELSGFKVRDETNPDGDIEIEFTGLRAGEKLFEELLIDGSALPTRHPRISQAAELALDQAQIDGYLERLRQASKNFDYYEVRAVLLAAVQGYTPQAGIEDWIWVERKGTAA